MRNVKSASSGRNLGRMPSERRSANPSFMIAAADEAANAGHQLRRVGLTAPSQVMYALALEIFLKAASQIERNSYLATHDHLALFGDLAEPLRDAVQARYQGLSASGRLNDLGVSFEERLGRVHKDFVEARYSYEFVKEEGDIQSFEDLPLIAAVVFHGLRQTLEKAPRARAVSRDLGPSGKEWDRVFRLQEPEDSA